MLRSFISLLLLAACLCLPARAQTEHPSPPRDADPRRDILAELRERGIEIAFTGNQIFSTYQLLDLFARHCPSAIDLLTRNVNNPETPEFGVRLIRNCLAAQGYLQAKLGTAQIESTAGGHKITVPVEEGALYRIGKIEIEGAKLFTPEQIGAMINLEKGDIANGEAIYEALFERLTRAYHDKGYLHYSADPEPTFHLEPGAQEGVVDYLVNIDEGKCFVLREVQFAGNATTRDSILRAALRLRDGKPFSQRLLEASVKNLNELNLFEWIDQGKDVDYTLDEKRTGVILTIKVREKN